MTSWAVERAVARVLFWGGLFSVSLMLMGLCAYAARDQPHAWEGLRTVQNRQAGGDVDIFTTLADVRRGLRQRPLEGLALATLGLLWRRRSPAWPSPSCASGGSATGRTW